MSLTEIEKCTKIHEINILVEKSKEGVYLATTMFVRADKRVFNFIVGQERDETTTIMEALDGHIDEFDGDEMIALASKLDQLLQVRTNLVTIDIWNGELSEALHACFNNRARPVERLIVKGNNLTELILLADDIRANNYNFIGKKYEREQLAIYDSLLLSHSDYIKEAYTVHFENFHANARAWGGCCFNDVTIDMKPECAEADRSVPRANEVATWITKTLFHSGRTKNIDVIVYDNDNEFKEFLEQDAHIVLQNSPTGYYFKGKSSDNEALVEIELTVTTFPNFPSYIHVKMERDMSILTPMETMSIVCERLERERPFLEVN